MLFRDDILRSKKTSGGMVAEQKIVRCLERLLSSLEEKMLIKK